MHLPPAFRLDDPEAIDALVREVGLATLVGARDDGALEVTHVPLVLRRGPGDGATLVGHVARASDTWRVLDGRPVTAIFQGPHAYVSAATYTSPADQVPTWNYVVVHVEGTLRTTTGPELRADLEALACTFEGPEPRWSLGTLSLELLTALEAAIVGVRVEVTRITAKAKVSQNRSPEDRARVRAMLAARGDTASLALVAHMDAAEARRASR
ncbi:MAG: FMN-binding negative transcriptional regulator [Myxococcales bacterium]|nr:FMN-binding negative transcriptional regulator [Myxococcales bacterium]